MNQDIPPKKILIAEDDPITRELITNSIESAGYPTVIAENGKQAVESLSNDIGVAILDLRMPEMDGMECLHFINDHFIDIQAVISRNAFLEGILHDDPDIFQNGTEIGFRGIIEQG